LETGVREFTRACQAWDGAGFLTAARWFEQAVAAAPESATNFYWLGTAHFHRVLHLRHQAAPDADPAELDRAMDAALAALGRAVKLDPCHAESHALLGTLYGMKIDGNLMRALRFGPRVEKHRKAALEHGPDNPRVRYLLGTCQFHTAKKPAAWREALTTLLAAEQLFAAEAQRPATPIEPRWGHASCLTFIGLTYEKLGQGERAAEYFRRALALQPMDHRAQAGLSRVVGGQASAP
jgi:tetratricopeptide (TPR) repeat protein